MYKSTFFLLVFIFLVVILMVTQGDNNLDIVYYDEEPKETSLYLLNEKNRLVEVNYNCKDDIEQIFNLLTKNANSLPLGVRTALPYRLELESYSLENDILHLNIANYDYTDFSQVVEALTWTYTALEGINQVFINTNNFVTSATRNVGINKTIEAMNIMGNKMVTIYYLGEYVMPVSYIVDEEIDEVEFIIDKTVDGDVSDIVKANALNIYLSDIEISNSNFENLSHTINELNMFESVNVYLNKDLIYSRFL